MSKKFLLITCLLISILSACTPNKSEETDTSSLMKSNEDIEGLLTHEKSGENLIEDFYRYVVLGTAPANTILQEICSQRLQKVLHEYQIEESRKYGDTDNCDDCMSTKPFVASDIEKLPCTTDTCYVETTTAESTGWVKVTFNYYGSETWARVKTITDKGELKLDSVITEK